MERVAGKAVLVLLVLTTNMGVWDVEGGRVLKSGKDKVVQPENIYGGMVGGFDPGFGVPGVSGGLYCAFPAGGCAPFPGVGGLGSPPLVPLPGAGGSAPLVPFP